MKLLLRINLLAFSLMAVQPIFSTGFKSISGGRQNAMGQCGVSLIDGWSVHNNQAGMAFLTTFESNIFYDYRFGLSQTSYKSGSIVFPVKFGTLGFDVSHFGYSSYYEMEIGAAYAKKLSENFAAGIKLDMLSVGLGESYGKTSFFTFEVGTLVKLTDNLFLGLHIFNPLAIRFSSYENERIPAIIRVGASYQITENLHTSLEVEKNQLYKPKIKAGIEYGIHENTTIRMGYYTAPAIKEADYLVHAGVFTFGFGLRFNHINIDISSNIHQVLGWSPQFSIRFIK